MLGEHNHLYSLILVVTLAVGIVYASVHPFVQHTSLYSIFVVSISSLWTCIDMSLLSGVPYPPKLLGRDALGLNPCSCVDGLENVSPFNHGVILGSYARFQGCINFANFFQSNERSFWQRLV